ncbi:hypothetical protein COD14_15370 [Bacillus cereus]|nr:hypothetical protein COD14_15370 [Bacillus cereus]
MQNTITQYSSSTGTLANFLVKDTFLINTQKLLPLSEAEKLWIQYEEFIMKKIHENINENKKRKKRY